MIEIIIKLTPAKHHNVIGIKECLAAELEEFGDIENIDVREVEPEQLSFYNPKEISYERNTKRNA